MGFDASTPEPEPGSSGDGDAADDYPHYPWLPPEDRLWRHPSEAARIGNIQTQLPQHAVGVSGARLWAVAMVAGLVGALAASGIGMAGGWWSRPTRVVSANFPSTSPFTVAVQASGSQTQGWTAVDEQVAPSVVAVTVRSASGSMTDSGLIVVTTSDGGGSAADADSSDSAYVVTDRSVLASAYRSTISVSFLSGATAQGRLVGQDPFTGLAVIEAADVDHSPAAAAGSVSDLRDADEVMAIGSRASTSGSVFPGAVTGEDVSVDTVDGTDRDDLIAVTAPQLPSTAVGGPLLSSDGRVVGVTVGVQTPDPAAQQLTFAVPVDEMLRVADDIISGAAVSHAWLGVVDAADVPAAMTTRYGADGGVEAGEVEASSPAAKAGLRASDIVTSFAGRPVTSAGTLVAALAATEPGQTVRVAWLDEGRPVSAQITLGSEPDDDSGS